MRKPPIFLDKPIAGAIIIQAGRQAALSLSVFAAQNFITHQQGALRPWIFHGCGALFCVRGKGGDCDADTLPAGDRGRGAPARGPVVGRTHLELAAALSGPHRPPAPHTSGAARASLH